jgi:two-component system chemotaxis sensor kinase CheA
MSDDKVSAVIAAGLSLRQSFLSWRNQEMGIFTQMGVFEDEGIEISRRRLADLSKRYAADPAKHAFLGELVQEMTMADFGDLMREFENHVVQVALKLGKKAQLQVVTTSEALRVPTNSYREVMRTFIHIFNNAIDHGIEPPDERVSHGKSEAGTIRVSYEQVTDKGMPFIKMQIVDDGRGINIAGIRAKLRGQGRSVENLSELEIAQHVFDDGLSTRDAVTAISGQGVGMGSVRSAILKIRGKIRVAKTDRHGTTFEILLPDRSVGAQKIDLPPSKAV